MAVRIKVMAKMNIAETRAPQDGRISATMSGRVVDFRVASLPTSHGENLVLRILDRQKGIVPLDKLGLEEAQLELLKRMIARPEGIILVTGPTGRGKTTPLHTNSAVGAFPRLLDIGIVPDILAGNIIGILAQRLVRRLCRTCRQSYDPDARERRLLGVTPTESAALYRAVGCELCDYQGFRGRQSILEILKVDGALDEMVARRATAREILAAACAQGFKTLADDGARLVRQGTTSLDELMRVVDLTDRMA